MLVITLMIMVKVTIRKKQNKLDQRTKIIMIIVLIFVVILAFSYINLRQKSKKIAKEQQQVESQLLASYESLYRLAYTYVKNPDDAMDVVQESAYRAIRDCRKVRNKDYLSTWIYRIVVNTALDMLRRKKKENITEELPEIPVEDQYQDLELRTVLNQLDDKSRTIILLRYFEDLKLEDIADIVGDNLNTVKARLYRSLKKLRLNLEAEHYREIPDKS